VLAGNAFHDHGSRIGYAVSAALVLVILTVTTLTSSPALKTRDSSTRPASRICRFAVHRPGNPAASPRRHGNVPPRSNTHPTWPSRNPPIPTEPDRHTQRKHTKCCLPALDVR
jgi:hypothetical protein